MARSKPTEAEKKWRAHVDAWSASGISMRAFALREGLNVGSLSAWQRRFRVESTPATTFAPLVVQNSSNKQQQAFELTLRDGIALRIPPDFDEAMLTRIVRAIGVIR